MILLKCLNSSLKPKAAMLLLLSAKLALSDGDFPPLAIKLLLVF